MKAISATAEVDADGWLNVHTRLPEKMPAGPVEAVIVLRTGQESEPVHAGKPVPPSDPARIAQCLRELRELGPIAGLEDPVAWQRSIREDRILPGEE